MHPKVSTPFGRTKGLRHFRIFVEQHNAMQRPNDESAFQTFPTLATKPLGKKKRVSDVKLHALLEVTKAINSNKSVEQLLRIYQEILVHELHIGKLALFLYDHEWKCVMRYGMQETEAPLTIDEHLLNIKQIAEVGLLPNNLGGEFDMVVPVFHKSQSLAYLLVGDLDEQKLGMSAAIKHLPFIQTLTNVMVVAIENKKLAKEYMRQIATNKELELASKMQNMLFPSELPRNEYLEVDAYYQPHLQVGGDYYDFFKINDNEMVMCMADVSGKGVSAALLMANFQANLRALFRNGSHLPDIISELNTLVSNNAKGEKFITLFLAKYNYITRVLTYINAGHNPPILFSHSARTWLTTGCIGLGMLSEIPSLKEGIFYLPHGSLIVCFTDGLVEQENPDGQDFGSGLLLETVCALQDRSVRDINMGIMDAVNNFRQNLPFGDDIALLTSRML